MKSLSQSSHIKCLDEFSLCWFRASQLEKVREQRSQYGIAGLSEMAQEVREEGSHGGNVSECELEQDKGLQPWQRKVFYIKE